MASPSPGKAAAPPSTPATSQDDDDDEFSLDFTIPSRLAKLSTASVQESKPKLELTLEPQSPAAGAAAPLAVSLEAPVVVAPSVPTFPLVHLNATVEQGAQLFAMGQVGEARKILEAALKDGKAIEAIWCLLFDVYRVLGAQETFEKLALDFARRFEKSPPAWGVQSVSKTPAAGDGRASVALTGSLNSRCASQFAKLVTVAKTRSMLRLDLSKIQDADNGGCALLLSTIHCLKNTPCEMVLGGAEHLAEMLKDKVASGTRENDAVWLLQLELYQRLNLVDAFEEMALNYAITFEVSPPSWEAPKAVSSGAEDIDELPELFVDDEKAATLSLSGELLNAGINSFLAIGAAFAEDSNEDVLVDFAQLSRIDQDSAMVLQQVLSALPRAERGERRVRLSGCSHMVAALLEMAGIGKLALVERARV